MTNIKFQEVTVVVNGSSRYNGNQYDSVMVHTTIITDSPLTESYYFQQEFHFQIQHWN